MYIIWITSHMLMEFIGCSKDEATVPQDSFVKSNRHSSCSRKCQPKRTSVSSQHEPTRRLRGGYSETETTNLFRLKRGKKDLGLNFLGSERRSSEDVSIGDTDRRREKTRIKDILGGRRGRNEVKVESQKKERVQKTAYGRSEEDSAEEMWSSSESSGSLLCSLAPAWLTARRRRRRAAPPGEWAVTVAGSCSAALPNDVEMRLRFPDPCRRPAAPAPTPPAKPAPPPPACPRAVECGAQCSQSGRARRVMEDAGRVTLTVKKEASDSSIMASKSVKKSSDLLPDLHTFRASRSKTRSSVKTRRGYSLHCWLPEDEPTPIRARNGLAVEGSAIVPHRKPRVPSMSERDLTRGPLPRHLRHLF